MTLIERDVFLIALQKHFNNVEGGKGHCILLSGEAGIGKSALIKAFCKEQSNNCCIFQGSCDDLFTPRTLAPLYDVLWQVNKQRWPVPPSHEERSVLFASFFQELSTKKQHFLIVFEDIHWADEGTLDFIKFFIRRIDQLPCLFILSYRDNEIYTNHLLRNVLGKLPSDSFTKLILTPLSKPAVIEMAKLKDFNGEEVYSITGGNPFYVNEILASYSPGVPDNIKDSILSVYERQKESTKNAWQLWSVMPEGLEVDRVARIKLKWDINHCFAIGVLIVQKDKVVFKHELYRRTIEESLTPFKRMEMNKMVLEFFLKVFEEKGEIERLLHYAKNANEKKLVVKYAPMAAKKATAIGAHKEASKLWHTVIEYAEDSDKFQLAAYYEAYARACYFSNQMSEAIKYSEKVLKIWKEVANLEKIGYNLCFLSHVCWFDGHGKYAEDYAIEALELYNDQPPSSLKAMSYSNMSRIKMLSDKPEACIYWGEKAIEMGKELQNERILSHALNNMGTVQMLFPQSEKKGEAMLNQSLEIALKNSYQEHAARAYSNLLSSAIRIKNYSLANRALEEGIRYCEEWNLHFRIAYLLALKARLNLDKGNWDEALNIADNLLKNEHQPDLIKMCVLIISSKIRMRKGEDALMNLLEAKTLAFETKEPQRIISAIIALAEYEWLTSKTIIAKEDLNKIIQYFNHTTIYSEKNEFLFWMKKAGRQFVLQNKTTESYDFNFNIKASNGTAFSENAICPYEQALHMFTGNEKDKRKALLIIQNLGATAVYEKLKQEMKNSGIKNIPRGIRASTRSNAAFLTCREMDILHLLKEELHNKEIANKLYISAKTVDHHVSSIMFKLEVNSRSKAVTMALQIGILK